MRFSGIRIGFGLTGSHCTIPKVLPLIQHLIGEGAQITPIVSPSVTHTDTRFGMAKDLLQKLETACGVKPWDSPVEAEPVGPKGLFEVVVVAPCTGNSLAKLALGLSDTAVTLACKSQLRNNRPVVLAISTNDGLSGNARNIATLLNRNHIYFVPFGQDAPNEKNHSLISKVELIPDSILAALDHRQIQPVLISY